MSDPLTERLRAYANQGAKHPTLNRDPDSGADTRFVRQGRWLTPRLWGRRHRRILALIAAVGFVASRVRGYGRWSARTMRDGCLGR